MKPKRLTDRTMRMIARRKRDTQWEFMERVGPSPAYPPIQTINSRVGEALRHDRYALLKPDAKALKNRERYDMEPIFGGMVEPGYVVTPWPRKRAA